jgi:hypothetical protein
LQNPGQPGALDRFFLCAMIPLQSAESPPWAPQGTGERIRREAVMNSSKHKPKYSIFSRTTRCRKICLILAAAALALGIDGCHQTETDWQLAVPWIMQETPNWCAPACIEMWILYDHSPDPGQEAIWDWILHWPMVDRIAMAVNYYTTLEDVWADALDARAPIETNGWFARQVTSIANGQPVIVGEPIEGHAVVAKGGKWHHDTQWGMRIWDYVYVNDPWYQPFNNQIMFDRWQRLTDCICPLGYCEQVISGGATAGWESYLSTYGPEIWVRGKKKDWYEFQQP